MFNSLAEQRIAHLRFGVGVGACTGVTKATKINAAATTPWARGGDLSAMGFFISQPWV